MTTVKFILVAGIFSVFHFACIFIDTGFPTNHCREELDELGAEHSVTFIHNTYLAPANRDEEIIEQICFTIVPAEVWLHGDEADELDNQLFSTMVFAIDDKQLERASSILQTTWIRNVFENGTPVGSYGGALT